MIDIEKMRRIWTPEDVRLDGEDPDSQDVLALIDEIERLRTLLEASTVYDRQALVGKALLGREAIVEIDTAKVHLRTEHVVLKHTHAGAVGLVLNFGEGE